MNKELIYSIGELLIMEIERVKNISYIDKPNALIIEMENGEQYELVLNAIKDASCHYANEIEESID